MKLFPAHPLFFVLRALLPKIESLKAAFLSSLALVALLSLGQSQTIIRVDSTPTAAWPGAVTNLQDALAIASPGSQIWIAEGVYYPDTGTGQTGNSRLSTFAIPIGVELHGGFVGSETSLATRMGLAANTILSGDLLGNDIPNAPTTLFDNAYHVVTINGAGLARNLSRLKVTAGNSDASAQNPVAAKAGGGILVTGGASLQILECLIDSNHGFAGGGMHIDSGGSVEVAKTTIQNNHVGDDGAGVMMTFASNPRFVACSFIRNKAQVNPNNLNSDGGGVFGGNGVFESCLFAFNDAKRGGGAYVSSGCRFVGCTFFGNSATFEGGAIYSSGVQELVSSILWGNSDQNGQQESSQLTFHGGVVSYSPSYCCIEGLSGMFGGPGNISADPLLLQPGSLDFHLTPASPCVNAGDPIPLIAPTADLEGDARALQCRIDMGCDESPYFEDLDSNGLPDSCESPGPGRSLCHGDGGDQMGCTDCPCMNNAAPGTIGGCLNSAGTASRIHVAGDTSTSLPIGPGTVTDLRFNLDGAPSGAFCVLLSGSAVATQGMANVCLGLDSGVQSMDRDGLRCAVTNIKRHGGRSANMLGQINDSAGPSRVWGGEAQPHGGIYSQGGFVSGQTRYFQVTHREDPTLGCMRGLNTSQAIEVTFTP